MTTKKQLQRIEEHKNSLLCNYPINTICVINGKAFTKTDKVNAHRKDQNFRLTDLRASKNDQVKPCIVWTFYNDSFVYGGWWLYVMTHKHDWKIDARYDERMIIKIMSLFPCGLLPMIENFGIWKKQFAKTFPVATKKRPRNQGIKIAWAKVSAGGRLLDVAKSKNALQCP